MVRLVNENDWIRLPPAGAVSTVFMFSAGIVPDNELVSIELPAGLYFLELNVADHMLSGRPGDFAIINQQKITSSFPKLFRNETSPPIEDPSGNVEGSVSYLQWRSS